MKTAFVYPGQGAQSVGMAADFWDSPLAQRANDLCGFDLLGAMKAGPEAALQETSVAQPALFLHSALVLEALEASGKCFDASFHLGLSLGEYSALYGAGAMSFDDVMRALVVRGRAMQGACERSSSGMLSILGMDETQIETVCASVRGPDEVLQVANLNAPGQIVVSGHLSAIERSVAAFRDAGARRAIPLKVAGAFHSPLMACAAEDLASCLEGLEINDRCAQVVSNVTARPHDPSQIKQALVEQITAPVRWAQSIEHLVDDAQVSRFCEWGTGKVTSGLIKRISRAVELKAAGSQAEIEQL